MIPLLRRYRFLLIVYAPAIALGVCEAQRRFQPASEVQLFDVLAELDPNSKQANFFKGYQAIERNEPEQARKYFEKALAASDNDEADEPLLRYYALVLIGLGEERELIDAAVERWRRRFPRSVYPDPRTIDPQRIRQELRNGLNAARRDSRSALENSY